MGWIEFIAAFGVFFLSHSLPVRPPLRPKLVALLGARGFTLAYSTLSLVILYWLIMAAAQAPFVEIWPFAMWQRMVPYLAMGVVCLVLCFTLGRPNPFSFGGTSGAFDPNQPGLVRWTRHPLLAALAIWSLAHMVPNGDLAHLILFGCFAGFALLGGRLIDRRKQQQMGPQWAAQLTQIRNGPLRPHFPLPALILRLIAAVALYLGLISLHPLFGIDVAFF